VESSKYLEVVRERSSTLLSVADQDFAVPVPSCPGWTVSDLVAHVGRI
jgi:hypothetical protein